MRLSRIYIDHVLVVGEEIVFPKEAAHYVSQVLRLRDGVLIVLFNGQGGEYRARLRLNKKQLSAVIEAFIDRSVASALPIHLGQGISRGEKMDYVVQKAVELGVAEITPLFTERCGVKLVEDRAQKRLDHWQKIIYSACEQSGRNDIPKINPPMNYPEWIVARTETHRLICHPGLASQNDKRLIAQSDTIALLVGAEGGFSDAEVNSATDQQFESFSLGPRILRTETAAVVALAKIQVCWGDMTP